MTDAAMNRGLPPALAEATDQFGRPRFYPFDEHPATERLRAQRRALRLLRAQHESRRYDPRYSREEIELAIVENEEALRYINAEITRFEELRAQADYLRMVSRRV